MEGVLTKLCDGSITFLQLTYEQGLPQFVVAELLFEAFNLWLKIIVELSSFLQLSEYLSLLELSI